MYLSVLSMNVEIVAHSKLKPSCYRPFITFENVYALQWKICDNYGAPEIYYCFWNAVCVQNITEICTLNSVWIMTKYIVLSEIHA
jgi:hypothetical protein